MLAEHTGGPELSLCEGLVSHLHTLAEQGERGVPNVPCRLRRHPSPTISERAALALVDPQKLPFDPDQVEDFDEEAKVDFVSSLGQAVRDLFGNRRDKG